MTYKDPSDAQLGYAKRLGLSVPQGATKWHVADLIDVHLGQDQWAPDWMKDYALRKSIKYVNRLEPIGEKRLMRMILTDLDAEDAGAWFSFWVFHDLTGSHKSKVPNPEDEIFHEAARQILNDPRVIKSINGYLGDSLLRFGSWTCPDGLNTEEGGSRRTIAYKATASFLSTRLNLPPLKEKTKTLGRSNRGTTPKQKKPELSGCLSVSAVVVILVAGGVWFGATLLV